MHRARLKSPLVRSLLCAAALCAGSASAGGAPSLHVVEMAVKGVKAPIDYISATNRRGPMLATCFGTKEAMRKSDPFEVAMEVAPNGSVQLVSLGRANQANPVEVDGCLLSQLNKTRFPEADQVVKLRMTLGPAPQRDEDSKED